MLQFRRPVGGADKRVLPVMSIHTSDLPYSTVNRFHSELHFRFSSDLVLWFLEDLVRLDDLARFARNEFECTNNPVPPGGVQGKLLAQLVTQANVAWRVAQRVSNQAGLRINLPFLDEVAQEFDRWQSERNCSSDQAVTFIDFVLSLVCQGLKSDLDPSEAVRRGVASEELFKALAEVARVFDENLRLDWSLPSTVRLGGQSGWTFDPSIARKVNSILASDDNALLRTKIVLRPCVRSCGLVKLEGVVA